MNKTFFLSPRGVVRRLAVLLLAGALPLVVPQSGHAQSVAWTKTYNGLAASDAKPGCIYGAKSKSQVRDFAGNIIITGCASNLARNDILTYKIDAASGTILWSATYNGSADGDDEGGAVAVDATGNVFITGASTDVVGGRNIRTIKYDGATGAEIWNVSFNGTGNGSDEGAGIVVDASGDVFVTGASAETVLSIRTIKYSGATGATLWSNAFAGTANAAAGRDIAIDSAGNVIVTASAFSNATGGDIVTLKYAGASGTQLWQATYDGAMHGQDDAYAVAVDASGDIFVTGNGVESQTAYGIVTIKYAGATGTQLWASVSSGGGYGLALAIDGGGNPIVTGSSSDMSGGTKIRTIKYAGSSGMELWSVAYDGIGGNFDEGRAVAVDAAGDVAVTGASTDAVNNQNIRTIKYNGLTGVILWNVAYDGGVLGAEGGRTAHLDAAGNVIVTGFSLYKPGRTNIRTIKYAGANGNLLWNVKEPPVLAAAAPIDIAVSTSGDIAVTGIKRGSDGQNIIRTAKYDGVTGNELWSALVDRGAVGDDVPAAVAFDLAGNVVMTGGSTGIVPGGSIRTVRYAGTTGAEMWNVTYDSTGSAGVAASAAATSLAFDAAGNVYVTGYSNDLAGGTNIRTIKYDIAAGTVLWTASYDGSDNDNDVGTAIVIGNGHAYVAGYGYDIVGDLNTRMIKYDGATGAKMWEAVYDSGGQDAAVALAVDYAGNPVLTGTTNSPSNGNDFLTIKYDGLTGQQLWHRTYNGGYSDHDRTTAMAIDTFGNVVVTGYSVDSVFDQNIRTIKYNGSSGAEIWSVAYGGNGGTLGPVDMPNDGANAIALDAGGNPVVTGFSRDASGYFNIRTLKYNGATGAQIAGNAYDGSAHGIDEGVKVVTGLGNSTFVLGRSLEAGKPQGWLVQKLTDGALPGAPTLSVGGEGNGYAVFTISAPGDAGGSPVTSYAITCNPDGASGGLVASAATSPMTVSGLARDIFYWCRAQAINASGAGIASSPVMFTKRSMFVTSVVSQKFHNLGLFELPIDASQPVTGAVTVEPRAAGPGHTIVFNFDAPVSAAGSVGLTDDTGTPVGSAILTPVGSALRVNLTGIPDNKRVKVVLTDVNNRLDVYSASLGFLLGDVNGSWTLDRSDVAAMKARSGQGVTNGNFWFDLNLSGTITAAEIAGIKARPTFAP